MITSIAATTGTTKFKLDSMMRIVSSAVISGILRVGGGAMVPETTNQSDTIFQLAMSDFTSLSIPVIFHFEQQVR